MERPQELTERQILAAQSLAAGFNRNDAAKRANCSPERIRIWKKTPEFNDAIWNYQQEIFHQTFGVTSEALPQAITKLRDIVNSDDENTPVAVKLQAIKILIDSAHKQYETRTIERRLDVLEAHAQQQILIEDSAPRELTASSDS